MSSNGEVETESTNVEQLSQSGGDGVKTPSPMPTTIPKASEVVGQSPVRNDQDVAIENVSENVPNQYGNNMKDSRKGRNKNWPPSPKNNNIPSSDENSNGGNTEKKYNTHNNANPKQQYYQQQQQQQSRQYPMSPQTLNQQQQQFPASPLSIQQQQQMQQGSPNVLPNMNMSNNNNNMNNNNNIYRPQQPPQQQSQQQPYIPQSQPQQQPGMMSPMPMQMQYPVQMQVGIDENGNRIFYNPYMPNPTGTGNVSTNVGGQMIGMNMTNQPQQSQQIQQSQPQQQMMVMQMPANLNPAQQQQFHHQQMQVQMQLQQQAAAQAAGGQGGNMAQMSMQQMTPIYDRNGNMIQFINPNMMQQSQQQLFPQSQPPTPSSQPQHHYQQPTTPQQQQQPSPQQSQQQTSPQLQNQARSVPYHPQQMQYHNMHTPPYMSPQQHALQAQAQQQLAAQPPQLSQVPSTSSGDTDSASTPNTVIAVTSFSSATASPSQKASSQSTATGVTTSTPITTAAVVAGNAASETSTASTSAPIVVVPVGTPQAPPLTPTAPVIAVPSSTLPVSPPVPLPVTQSGGAGARYIPTNMGGGGMISPQQQLEQIQYNQQQYIQQLQLLQQQQQGVNKQMIYPTNQQQNTMIGGQQLQSQQTMSPQQQAYMMQSGGQYMQQQPQQMQGQSLSQQMYRAPYPQSPQQMQQQQSSPQNALNKNMNLPPNFHIMTPQQQQHYQQQQQYQQQIQYQQMYGQPSLPLTVPTVNTAIISGGGIATNMMSSLPLPSLSQQQQQLPPHLQNQPQQQQQPLPFSTPALRQPIGSTAIPASVLSAQANAAAAAAASSSSSTAASSATTPTLPPTVPAPRKFVVKDKDGNILDLDSLKKDRSKGSTSASLSSATSVTGISGSGTSGISGSSPTPASTVTHSVNVSTNVSSNTSVVSTSGSEAVDGNKLSSAADTIVVTTTAATGTTVVTPTPASVTVPESSSTAVSSVVATPVVYTDEFDKSSSTSGAAAAVSTAVDSNVSSSNSDLAVITPLSSTTAASTPPPTTTPSVDIVTASIQSLTISEEKEAVAKDEKEEKEDVEREVLSLSTTGTSGSLSVSPGHTASQPVSVIEALKAYVVVVEEKAVIAADEIASTTAVEATSTNGVNHTEKVATTESKVTTSGTEDIGAVEVPVVAANGHASPTHVEVDAPQVQVSAVVDIVTTTDATAKATEPTALVGELEVSTPVTETKDASEVVVVAAVSETAEDWEVSASTVTPAVVAPSTFVTPVTAAPATVTPSVTTTTATTTPVVAAAASTPYVVDKKGKKSFKHMLEKADAQDSTRGIGGMLDAYAATPTPAVVPVVTVASAGTTNTTASSASTLIVTEPVEADAEVEESWEKSAETIDLKITAAAAATAAAATSATASAPRRLIPGGGGGSSNQTRLNGGFAGSGTNKSSSTSSSSSSSSSMAAIRFLKDELIKLKFATLPERPPAMTSYSQVSVVEHNKDVGKLVPVVGYFNFAGVAAPSLATKGGGDGGGAGVSERSTKESHSYVHQSNKGGGDGRDRTGSGSSSRGGGSGTSAGAGDESGGSGISASGERVSGWKRVDPLPSIPTPSPQQQQSQSSQSAQYSRKNDSGRNQMPSPRPQKIITDPMLQLKTEVMQILNKITPQTFEKLTLKMCEIPVATNALLDKLIELVFEKAIQEPNFANLYADMCAALENESRYWAFLQIGFNQDSNEYIWILDLEFDTELAGPYTSVQECTTVALSPEPLPYQHFTFKVQVEEVIIANNIVIKIFKKFQASPSTTAANSSSTSTTTTATSSSSAAAEGSTATTADATTTASSAPEYYVSISSFDDINKDKMSKGTFETQESARKDALKKNSFRRRLVSICQQEFQQSTTNEGVYSVLKDYHIWKTSATRNKLLPDERQQQEAEWEDKKFKLKKRMLGNVRFIGELYKKGLITTKTIYNCLFHLIGRYDVNDEWIGWIESKELDEQDLEILCKFLPTVGGLLELKISDDQYTQINWFFDQLKALSKDKLINSRIRFSLEEMIALREHNWQARRVDEGPLKIEEIHQKIAQEEYMKQQQQQQILMQQQQQQQYGRGGGGSSKYQQQQGSYTSGGRPSPQQQQMHGGRGSSGTAGGNVTRPSTQQFAPTGIMNSSSGGDRRIVQGQGNQSQSSSQQQGAYSRGGSSGSGMTAGSSGRGGAGGRFYNSGASSGSSGGGGSSNNQSNSGNSASGSNDSSTAAVTLVLSSDEMRGRMRSILREYCNHKDITDIKNCLTESGADTCGYFIQALITMYLDTNSKETMNTLLKLLDGDSLLASILTTSQARNMIETGLREYEPLLLLLDALNDNANTHIRIGQVVGQLVHINACRMEVVNEIVDSCCQPDKAAEQDVSLENLKNTYSFFLNAMNR